MSPPNTTIQHRNTTIDIVPSGRKQLSPFERQAFDYFSVGGASLARIQTPDLSLPQEVEYVARVENKVLYFDAAEQAFGLVEIDDDNAIHTPSSPDQLKPFSQAVKSWLVPLYCELIPTPKYKWRIIRFSFLVGGMLPCIMATIIALFLPKPIDGDLLFSQASFILVSLLVGYIEWRARCYQIKDHLPK